MGHVRRHGVRIDEGMDHRWDEMLQAEHRRRVEEERYRKSTIENDRDVERRDQLTAARMCVNRSPWEIGAAHWDQRDLYTTSSETDETGYARGPSVHPDVGSYAYHRDIDPALVEAQVTPSNAPGEPTLYEREAWPWFNYDHFEQGPKGRWHRADESIREDVLEALAYDPRLDATEIEVEVKDGEVTLKGTVPDLGQKRLAEEIATAVRSVDDVHNRLTVESDDDTSFPVPEPVF